MNIKERVVIFTSFFIILMVFIAMFFVFILPPQNNELIVYNSNISPQQVSINMVTFKNKEDFSKYLKASESENRFIDLRRYAFTEIDTVQNLIPEMEMFGAKLAESPDFSTTNVRTLGIDEPDIVKTDGKYIYLSSRILGAYPIFKPEPTPIPMEDNIRADEMRSIPPSVLPLPDTSIKNKISVISALPPGDMNIESVIEDGDEILVSDNKLIVVSTKYVRAYDLLARDKKSIKKVWEFVSTKGSYIDKVRLLDRKLYIVSRNSIVLDNPCPVIPFVKGDTEIMVPCSSIYRPVKPMPVSDVYSIFAVNIDDGQEIQSVSFLGLRDNFVYYMTKNNIYLTYVDDLNWDEIIKKYVLGSKVLPDDVRNNFLRVLSYDISYKSKMVEFENIFNEYISGLDADTKLKFVADLENEWSEYVDRNIKDILRTVVVRIDTNSLRIKNSGSFPGRLLNEFSIDEYDNYLRVATTLDYTMVGRVMWFIRLPDIVSSKNAVYVLDKDMNIVGSVEDLGITERIYSARFMGDKVYLVTFRQIDPFYVIDLSNPYRPYKAGELKIPGYSSYLHPLNKDLIVGIGKDGASVKISLFDVSDPSNPKETDKYVLSSVYWSDILNNYRAFLLDKRFKVFFVPAGKAVYVFSYKDKKLDLVKSVVVNNPKRALYIDDYAYIVGQREIVAVDENSWERAGEINILMD